MRDKGGGWKYPVRAGPIRPYFPPCSRGLLGSEAARYFQTVDDSSILHARSSLCRGCGGKAWEGDVGFWALHPNLGLATASAIYAR